MNYEEVIAAFDQLDIEIIQFLHGEETVEGDKALHDLAPRLNMLCTEVLKLPLENMSAAKARLTDTRNQLQKISDLMQEIAEMRDDIDLGEAETILNNVDEVKH